MVSIGGPANDRFQVIAEHDAENFAYDPNHLGIARGVGRTTEQKRQLFKSQRTREGRRHPDQRCFRHARGFKRENWSFGMGIAQ